MIWCVFGLIVGSIAKIFTPGKDPAGCMFTIMIGVAGSFMGGLLNWCLGYGTQPLHPSGFIMSIIGGVIALYLYKKFMNKTE
jgi:uncharacterized membrane protein YeaQ/YmgE (transglycosylase-associated protein family)